MQQITHISNLKQPVIAVIEKNGQLQGKWLSFPNSGLYTSEGGIVYKKLGEVLSDKTVSFDCEELVVQLWESSQGGGIYKNYKATTISPHSQTSEESFISALISEGISFEELKEKNLKLIILKPKV